MPPANQGAVMLFNRISQTIQIALAPFISIESKLTMPGPFKQRRQRGRMIEQAMIVQLARICPSADTAPSA